MKASIVIPVVGPDNQVRNRTIIVPEKAKVNIFFSMLMDVVNNIKSLESLNEWCMLIRFCLEL